MDRRDDPLVRAAVDLRVPRSLPGPSRRDHAAPRRVQPTPRWRPARRWTSCWRSASSRSRGRGSTRSGRSACGWATCRAPRRRSRRRTNGGTTRSPASPSSSWSAGDWSRRGRRSVPRSPARPIALGRARLLPAAVEIALASHDAAEAREAADELHEIAGAYDAALWHASARQALGGVPHLRRRCDRRDRRAPGGGPRVDRCRPAVRDGAGEAMARVRPSRGRRRGVGRGGAAVRAGDVRAAGCRRGGGDVRRDDRGRRQDEVRTPRRPDVHVHRHRRVDESARDAGGRGVGRRDALAQRDAAGGDRLARRRGRARDRRRVLRDVRRRGERGVMRRGDPATAGRPPAGARVRAPGSDRVARRRGDDRRRRLRRDRRARGRAGRSARRGRRDPRDARDARYRADPVPDHRRADGVAQRPRAAGDRGLASIGVTGEVEAP